MDKPARMDELFGRRPYLLAPMAGVCDVTFRSLCKELGAGLTYTEMVSAKGLEHLNEKTSDLLALAPNEDVVVVQLFGHEPAVMARQAAMLEERLGNRLAAVDINMGCPVRKVAGKGEGAALSHHPDLASRIVQEMDQATSVPVSVKIRKGLRPDEDNCVDFALRLQEAGAAAVTVHGRTAAQFYEGQADWEAIARVAEALDIPVVGNGDIADLDQADERLACIPGLSAVMVGRAARSNPFLFCRRVPSIEERVELARRHARGLQDNRQLLRMRKFLGWYLSGVPNATTIRRIANTCTTLPDFEDLLDRIPDLATLEMGHVTCCEARDEGA